jgi:hypothetical protein
MKKEWDAGRLQVANWIARADDLLNQRHTPNKQAIQVYQEQLKASSPYLPSDNSCKPVQINLFKFQFATDLSLIGFARGDRANPRCSQEQQSRLPVSSPRTSA